MIMGAMMPNGDIPFRDLVRAHQASEQLFGCTQVITEDSDLLAYGCARVLFKMDRTGVGQEICVARLPEARNPSFVGFSQDMFLEASL